MAQELANLRQGAFTMLGLALAGGGYTWVLIQGLVMHPGFDWRQPGCSMCLGTNGDIARPGERVASTSNRNFMGRQGPGARTHLLSPAMAAAAAVTGRFADVRVLMEA